MSVTIYEGIFTIKKKRKKARFYSKSQKMVELSLKLLRAKRNKFISMQIY